MTGGSWSRGWSHDSKDGADDESWSQGRLGPSVISQAKGERYLHEYLRASTVSREKALGVGSAREIASNYPANKVEDHLNQRDAEGWRLLSMEPHWWYEEQGVSMAMSIAKPLAIVGWYLTFERA